MNHSIFNKVRTSTVLTVFLAYLGLQVLSSWNYFPMQLVAEVEAASANVCVPGGHESYVCTAGDVKLGSLTNVTVLEPCDGTPGDTATISVIANLDVGSSERDDIGIWLGNNPSCTVFNLDPNTNTGAHDDGDMCGDTTSNQDIVINLGSLVVNCEDTNDDGILDLPYLISWDQNADKPGETCSSPAGTAPGTKSKCDNGSFALPGVVVPDEICDGIDNDSDGFTDELFDDTDGDGIADCVDTPVCGNGFVEGTEICDDKDLDNTDGCTTSCQYTCTTNTQCSNNNVCDGTETCNTTTHVCENGTPLVVDDGLFCTVDSCDPVSGVSHTPIAVDDGLFCTVDSCNEETNTIDHTPIAVDDDNACTVDSCNEETNTIDHTAIAVDDNNACTIDTCSPGVGIIHTPVNVNDNNVCTIDSCDPVSGVSNTPVNLDDADSCTADSCDAISGITHAFICECRTDEDCGDENVCNGTETCQSGTCVVGTPLITDDEDVCTADSCDATGGATHTIIDNDTDGVADCRDNCLGIANSDQADIDGDGKGDVCDPAECGNEVIEPTEACDDGNDIDTDGCNTECQISTNGLCGSQANQIIYDANNGGDALTMQSEGLCASGTLQNFVWSGSAHQWTWDCNGTNSGSSISCSAQETYCGNGSVQEGEACDDGNQNNTDACSNSCVVNVCGDGVVNNGEACDAGTGGSSTCSVNCTIINTGGGTSGGGTSGGGGQASSITTTLLVTGGLGAVCGNGKIEGNETCDDKNLKNGDGCTAACMLEEPAELLELLETGPKRNLLTPFIFGDPTFVPITALPKVLPKTGADIQ